MVTYGNFMLPSVLCYEDKVDRKVTNYSGIISVRIFNNYFRPITQNYASYSYIKFGAFKIN